VDALFASTETVEAMFPSRRDELLAAALLVALRSLRAATGKTEACFLVRDENPAALLASVSPTETDTRSARPRSRRGLAPLVSAACAEAAASADGVGAGGVSAADALGYEFLGSAASRSDDAAGSGSAESAAEHSRCLATTHRVLAPYLHGGRALSAGTRARAPHFALAALFSELKLSAEETRAETRGDATEKTAAFLCAHLLCLVGRWRSAVAEACAEGEALAGTPASASAAAELLGTAEPTRATLTRPAADAVAAALAPPWSDALEASARAAARDARSVGETYDTHRPSHTEGRAEFFVDDEDAHFTEASCVARADAERAATDARERAFAAFDARWRHLGAVSGADRGEGDETSEEASDPADPLTPFANLTAKMAHVASRWRELLERASAARAAAENAAREEARRGDEAWRAFAARCAEAGFGAVDE
jgi:hypothetical protein